MSGEIIRAIIPSDEQPPRYLVTDTGEMPSLAHEPAEGERRTFEGTLSMLGRSVMGRVLSVNYGRRNYVYEAKPIPSSVPLNPGHTWQNTRPSL